MRDPKRMDGVLAAVKELWEQVPDWRFTQLMCNLQSYCRTDMFYVEDDKFIDILKEYSTNAKR